MARFCDHCNGPSAPGQPFIHITLSISHQPSSRPTLCMTTRYRQLRSALDTLLSLTSPPGRPLLHSRGQPGSYPVGRRRTRKQRLFNGAAFTMAEQTPSATRAFHRLAGPMAGYQALHRATTHVPTAGGAVAIHLGPALAGRPQRGLPGSSPAGHRLEARLALPAAAAGFLPRRKGQALAA